MSAQLQESDEIYWRPNNFRTEITRTSKGLDVHFFCCERHLLFPAKVAYEKLSRVVTEHITGDCPPLLRPVNFVGQATARTKAERLTLKQEVAIKVIAREHGINPDELCLTQLKCCVDQLNGGAASALIDWLKREISGR